VRRQSPLQQSEVAAARTIAAVPKSHLAQQSPDVTDRSIQLRDRHNSQKLARTAIAYSRDTARPGPAIAPIPKSYSAQRSPAVAILLDSATRSPGFPKATSRSDRPRSCRIAKRRGLPDWQAIAIESGSRDRADERMNAELQ